MKRLIPILAIILLSGCEVTSSWFVTTTTKVEQWNTTTVTKVNTSTSSYTEVVVDYTEKEIKEYCAPSYYSEQYGQTLYKYFTTKTYVEQK